MKTLLFRIKRYAGFMISNPRWMLMDLLSRFYWVRRSLRWIRLRMRPKAEYPLEQSVFEGLQVDTAATALEKDGLFVGLSLPDATRNEILALANQHMCYGDGLGAMGFPYARKAEAQAQAGKTFSQAVYANVLQDFAPIDALSKDPVLLAIAHEYFGGRPMFTDCRLWWTFAASADTYDVTQTSSFYHYDKDDYAGLRVFFYLTDVDDQTGPHFMIKGSHRKKRLAQLISLGERDESALFEQYGDDSQSVVTGPAGTGFLEDPFCFHRASRPQSGDRLVLQLRFATFDYQVFDEIQDRQALALPVA